MRRKLHLSLDVRGALQRTDDELLDLAESTVVDGVPLRTPSKMRAFLLEALDEGYDFLPMSPECDNFDPKRGCLGHVVSDSNVSD